MAHLVQLKRVLSFLILGQKGGKNRSKIIELLHDRPYNINQMSEHLDLNYRTVKHHVDTLLKYELVSSSKTGGYGDVFFLSPELEGNMHIYTGIVDKMEEVKQLTDFMDSPNFFKSVLQKTYEGVIIVDIEWEVFFWNESASRIFGFHDEEFRHWPLDIFLDESEFSGIKKMLDKEGRLNDIETCGKTMSGERLDINITIDPILNANDKLIGYSIMVRDISERKRIENRIKMKKDTLEIIMENIRTGVAYLDREYNFLNVNSAYARESGHSKEELIGQNHFKLFPNKENEAIFNNVRESGNAKEVIDRPYEFSDHLKRSSTHWNWSLVPVKDESGSVSSLVLTLREISRE
ncbi:MAG: PAS domain S-box protein [Thermoplasmatota archaeon]